MGVGSSIVAGRAWTAQSDAAAAMALPGLGLAALVLLLVSLALQWLGRWAARRAARRVER